MVVCSCAAYRAACRRVGRRSDAITVVCPLSPERLIASCGRRDVRYSRTCKIGVVVPTAKNTSGFCDIGWKCCANSVSVGCYITTVDSTTIGIQGHGVNVGRPLSPERLITSCCSRNARNCRTCKIGVVVPTAKSISGFGDIGWKCCPHSVSIGGDVTTVDGSTVGVQGHSVSVGSEISD